MIHHGASILDITQRLHMICVDDDDAECVASISLKQSIYMFVGATVVVPPYPTCVVQESVLDYFGAGARWVMG